VCLDGSGSSAERHLVRKTGCERGGFIEWKGGREGGRGRGGAGMERVGGKGVVGRRTTILRVRHVRDVGIRV
jgi:hypothetical protein